MSSNSDSKHGGLQDLNTKMKLPQVFGPILTQDTSQKYLPDLKKLKMNKVSLSKPKKSVKTGMSDAVNLQTLNYTTGTSSQGLDNLGSPKYEAHDRKNSKTNKIKINKVKKVKYVKPIVPKLRVSPKNSNQGIKVH